MDCKLKHRIAQVPKQQRSGDAGYDLTTTKNRWLWPFVPTVLRTGLIVRLPPRQVGIIKDRSGMGVKGIHVLGGVIDSNYRGEVMVCLINLSLWPRKIKKRQRVAQMIVLTHSAEYFTRVQKFEDDYSARGGEGFGSSDIT